MKIQQKQEDTNRFLNKFMQEGLFSLPDYSDPKHTEMMLAGNLILGDEDFQSMELEDLARKVDTDPRSSLLLENANSKNTETIQAFLGNE